MWDEILFWFGPAGFGREAGGISGRIRQTGCWDPAGFGRRPRMAQNGCDDGCLHREGKILQHLVLSLG